MTTGDGHMDPSESGDADRRERLDYAQEMWGEALNKTAVAKAVVERFGVAMRTAYRDAAESLERGGGSRRYMRNWWHAVLTKSARKAVSNDDLATVAKLCQQHRGIFRLDMDAIEMMTDDEQRALFVQSFEDSSGDFDAEQLHRLVIAAKAELAKR